MALINLICLAVAVLVVACIYTAQKWAYKSYKVLCEIRELLKPD